MKNFTGQFLTVPTLDHNISDSHSSEGLSLSPCSDFEIEGDMFFEVTTDDTDAISSDTKKIRKKRTAYQKIDDDIRLELLDAVQRRGESLKSASKRLNINYSSAKSILHTFRKEGRILKKNALEKNIRVTTYPATMAMDMSPMNEIPQLRTDNFPKIQVSFSDASAPMIPSLKLPDHRNSSPMKGLTENFGNLFVNQRNESAPTRIEPPLQQQYRFEFQYRNPHNTHNPQNPQNPQPRPVEQQRNSVAPNFSSIFKMTPQMMEISPMNQTPTAGTQNAPLEGFKSHVDNFYMNYSNSPLSGGGPNIYKEGSNTGSKSAFHKEFDSFSDMITAIQSQPKVAADDSKKGGEFVIPRTIRQSSINQGEKTGNEENIDSNIIMAEKENVKGGQFLVDDALKRAAQFSAFQKSGSTPTAKY
jgi:predicted transcriptional regulator